MQAKNQKEFKMTIGTNANVDEKALIRIAVEMEEVLNAHFVKYRVHINEKEDK